jgi:hypothetical protein
MNTDAATPTSADGYMVYKPSFKDKAARFFGYRHQHGVEPPDHEKLTQGWARTETSINFTLGDRLRLLFSGKLRISHTHYTDGHFDTMQSRMDMTLYAPWEDGRG